MEWLKTLYQKFPWLLISTGIVMTIAFLVSLIVVGKEQQQLEIAPTTVNVRARIEKPQETIQPPEEIDRKSIPRNVESELVSYEEEVAIPMPEPDVVDYHLDRGDPDSVDNLPSGGASGGTSAGVGTGGHYGTGTPSILATRRAGTGLRKGRGGGATQGTEAAVLEGLRWLMRHQNDDGSWTVDTISTHCTTNPPCVPATNDLGSKFDTGTTGLALLAFLGQGISTDSKFRIVDTALGNPGRASGEIVKSGIKWLIERQKPDGSFSSEGAFEYPENDTLPTMALCEAYGLSHAFALKGPAQRALEFLIAAQKRRADGTRTGWGPGSYAVLVQQRDKGEIDEDEFEQRVLEVDPTITSWVVMALKSAESCGLKVPADVLPGALAFVNATAAGDDAASPPPSNDSKFVYHKARRKALGMLTRTFAGAPITDPYFEQGARELAADVPEASRDGYTVDFYYWYFGTLALNQYDGQGNPRANSGRYWGRWNQGLIEALLPLQDDTRKPDVCSRGGWLQMSHGGRKGMELRNTALNVMTLEVYYRFDNVFGAKTRPAATPR